MAGCAIRPCLLRLSPRRLVAFLRGDAKIDAPKPDAAGSRSGAGGGGG